MAVRQWTEHGRAETEGDYFQMKTMHLFAGAGGGLLADLILGHEPVVAVEWEDYPVKTLKQRAEEGWFPGLEVWHGDVREFTGEEYKGRVDCINAGFPCQDLSAAGKGAGLGEGTRSGLYREVLRIADVVRPQYLFLENVPTIKGKGLEVVLYDLASRGYSAEWMCLSAASVGAPHQRDRWWCLAKAESSRSFRLDDSESHPRGGHEDGKDVEDSRHGSGRNRLRGCAEQDGRGRDGAGEWISATTEITGSGETSEALPYAPSERQGGVNTQPEPSRRCGEMYALSGDAPSSVGWFILDPAETFSPQSHLGGVVDGLAAPVDRITPRVKGDLRANRLKAIGNGQVPLVAAVAFTELWRRMEWEASVWL